MKKYFIFIPNLLTIVRIALVYPILNNIYLGNFEISIIYFLFASVTDGLDGFIARKMNWQTELGTLLDPVAELDSFSMLLKRMRLLLSLHEQLPFHVCALQLLFAPQPH